jgi:hypothetical protein
LATVKNHPKHEAIYKAGAQGAKTELKIGINTYTKSTTDNMHAEMMVLKEAEKKGDLTINPQGEIVLQDGTSILQGAMKTTTSGQGNEQMPHCGYCSVFLTLLGVPAEKPTSQPSVFAGSQGGKSYIIPKFISHSTPFIVKVSGIDEQSLIDQTLAILKVEAGEKEGLLQDIKNLGTPTSFDNIWKGNLAHYKEKFLTDHIWEPFTTELTEQLKNPSKTASSAASKSSYSSKRAK